MFHASLHLYSLKIYGGTKISVNKKHKTKLNETLPRFNFYISITGTVAFNAVLTLSRLSFNGQLLEQFNVSSVSLPAVFLQCYSLLLLYFGQIIEC